MCPPRTLSAIGCVCLILPLELRCKPCVVYSAPTIVPVSMTLMWDISCLIKALSSWFTLLILLLIHNLPYLLRRLTNVTFVLLVLSAMKLRSLYIEQSWFISRLFPAPPTMTIWSCLGRSSPSFLKEEHLV